MRERPVKTATWGVDDATIAVPLVSLATLGIAGLLVSVRGEVHPEVTALVLATTVALGARIGGRAAGIASSLIAALSFDFFHTRPYLSLKINDGNDVLATVLLLAVGLVVGGLSARAQADRRTVRAIGGQGAVLRRVLTVAGDGDAEDVELAVRAELLELLRLSDCQYRAERTDLPTLGSAGQLTDPQLRYHDEGFELPKPQFAIPVDGFGQHFGQLVCVPLPDIGIDISNRRTAVALAEVLGLVLGAPHPRDE